jgi:hypothetical protein
MANTGVPLAAIAAAAWSCVLKMLHEAQRTSAPSACSVSISTAVWIVMCRAARDARAFQGLLGRKFLADGHQAGHFGLGNADFLAAPGGEGNIGNGAVSQKGGIDSGVHGLAPKQVEEKPLTGGEETGSPHTFSG